MRMIRPHKPDFTFGDKIRWDFIHRFGRVRTPGSKLGYFIGTVKHRKPVNEPLARVQFENNKGESRVPLYDLKPWPPKNEDK